jgi:FkbM family methyltransferase
MGVYTEKLAATGAEVHAYEPDPHCFAALQTRFADRANVHLHNQAVSGEAGQFILRRTRDFAQNPDLRSQSSSIAVNDPLQYDPQTGFKVETLAFVDVVSHFARPIALIKMDIEGAEFSILTQLFADMDRTRALPIGALFVETHERHFPQHVALVKSLREMNWDGALPFPIDAFWP